jgi:hypothetical protein
MRNCVFASQTARIEWAILMQILKEIGMDWRERRLIGKLYMDQSVKQELTKRRQEV